MGCCGSEDDYYTVTPYRPPNEKPHPSVYNQRQPERHNQPRYRDPRREEADKRQRQAQATAAARNYGWPTTRGVAGNTNHHRGSGSRDSIIEPGLAGGLAAMPGSDFRAVYDPQRHRQRQQQQQQRQQQPIHRPNPVPPFQRPPYYQQRFVSQQPPRMPMMSAIPRASEEPLARRQQVIARKPVVQGRRTQFHAPQVARLVRRDSNGISECSDDDFDREDLRQYTVSPIQSPPPPADRGYRTFR
ncbi:hypothetical protein F5B22DRAFT_529634 [Xylaria bambusicola]|uniref:uncharacterized protein n=1 Tax=Xylaria bambusicola TaxID=326684 RepID=UPI0020089AE9|nr:uncharacterized protein F5B22DRAFT_529634 [Xylaria bambusicola]KAI0505239.1 hypothetical protein F5B22DRAFT_529634 [Xylaria bambusicola]